MFEMNAPFVAPPKLLFRRGRERRAADASLSIGRDFFLAVTGAGNI
jgi:hypothetical protein